MPSAVPPARPLPVVVFGDGGLPEILLTCLQFRLVAGQMMVARAEPSHLMQLAGHLERTGCPSCRRHLDQLLAERRAGMTAS